jgi:hypothetical protein
VGDLGNLSTWPVPVNIRVVRGIWPDKVVQSAAGLHAGRVGPAFAAVVRSLVREGAAAITTTCGFLVLLQKELQAATRVPVITSSLMLLPRLLAAQPRVGVLTISATRLGARSTCGPPVCRASGWVMWWCRAWTRRASCGSQVTMPGKT